MLFNDLLSLTFPDFVRFYLETAYLMLDKFTDLLPLRLYEPGSLTGQEIVTGDFVTLTFFLGEGGYSKLFDLISNVNS